MTPLYIIAEIFPSQDKLEEVHSLFTSLVRSTVQEPGCLLYDLVIEESADHWLMLEKWESEAAWRSHMETQHVKTANEMASSLVRAETRLRFLSAL